MSRILLCLVLFLVFLAITFLLYSLFFESATGIYLALGINLFIIFLILWKPLVKNGCDRQSKK